MNFQRFKGENKLMWDRKTTVKRGRKENEWPKDAELSGCPFFSIELSNKIDVRFLENKRITKNQNTLNNF